MNPVLPPAALPLYAVRAMKENQTLLDTQVPLAAQSRSVIRPPRRVLVVDDDVAVRQLSMEVLTHHGFQVDTAADGAAGLDALHAHQYDLLITDNNMPKLTGAELVKRLRSAYMTLPVIMVSGVIPEELKGNPWLLDATLLKPFTIGDLLDSVDEVLRAAETRREQILAPPEVELPSSTDRSQVRTLPSVLP